MQPPEFAAFRERFIADWAADLTIVEDLPSERAHAEVRRRVEADLTCVLDTKGHHLRMVIAGATAVGTLWFSIAGDRAFLDDITIAEAHRSSGYGWRALLEVLSHQG